MQAGWAADMGGPGDLERGTIVALPSITFPSVELRKITGIQFYEERLMYLLLLLRSPKVRLVYLTSLPVDPAIVDYYLSFIGDEKDAQARLKMISVGDPEPSALTGKLLRASEVMEGVKEFVDGDTSAYIFPFNVTELEGRFAEHVGLPLYGPRPDLVPLGSKSGSRRIAVRAGVPLLEGSEDLYSIEDVETAVMELKKNRPGAEAAVIKLNNGFSGQGNAIVDFNSVRFPLIEAPTTFCAFGESWAAYVEKIASEGAVVEELVRVPGTESPSVQLRIAPSGSVDTLSTHDQILGGPDDQVYLGCRFPARSDYRRQILDLALETAKVLADEGVVGPFGIDFLVVPGSPEPDIYLSEINLRVGGTTHPFNMALLATKGTYDVTTGELSVDGVTKYYVATDNLKSDDYLGMTPQQAITALDEAGLAYDDSTKTGATLHLLGALPQYGKLGALCIANSREAATDLYENVVAAVDVAASS